MELKIENKVTVTLVMSEEEATWLMEHFCPDTRISDGSPEKNTMMQKKFFNALLDVEDI